MFLGYQNNKIVLTANTRAELENAPCMTFDSIEETDASYTLYNGDYLTDNELQQAQKEAAKKDLMAQLDALDLKCIRALRAIQSGNGTADDEAKLADLEAQAEEIRKELQLLNPVTEAEQ